MKRLLAILSVIVVFSTVVTPALGKEESALADAVKYFAQNYGSDAVRPDVPKPPVRLADVVDPLSPFGGPSGLPPDATDPFALNTVVEARFNLGGPGFPDASGGGADSILGLSFDADGNPVFHPMPLPDGSFWVPPSGPDTIVGGPSLGEALGLDLDERGIQTFGGDDVLVARHPAVSGTVPADGVFIVRGGTLQGPAISLDLDCGGSIIELGTADRLTGEPVWPAEFAPNDIFKDASRAHVARCQPGSGWTMARFDNQGDFFSEQTTSSFTLVSNNWWLTFHRPDELAASEGHRTFVFTTPGSNPYQPDTTAFFSHPAFPEMFNTAAPLIGFDPFPGEMLGSPIPLYVDLTGSWVSPTDGSSGCDYYAREYTALIDLYPATALSGDALPIKFYDVLSGQVGEGSATSNGELRIEGTGSGEGYTESWQMKGQAVEYLHSDEHGDCLYAGTVTGGYEDARSFFDVFWELGPTETPPATDAPTATDAPVGSAGPATTDGVVEEGGSFRTWNPLYFVLGGVALLIGGFWVYSRTRERTSGGTGGTTPPPEEPPGGATVAPPMHHDDDDDRGGCDWALYFNGKRLRGAQGHECCVYHLSVQTTNPEYEMASKGRQDGKNPHGEDASPDERLRMFDFDMFSAAPDMKGYAGTRTGPAGRQDWMHGLGDPVFEAGWKSTDAGSQHLQEKPLEEPVDVGVSLRYALETTVKASLTPGCPEHDNWYTLDASSGITMFATQECTNGEPGPECPVELTASGIVDASVKGDVAYPLVMLAGTYPDEVERKSPDWLQGPIGGIDSHDHATRPRSTWEETDSNAGANQVNKDDTQVVLYSKLHLDSGQIVPIETWDTTERVTTDIRAELDHTLNVAGEMSTDCTEGCGGHGACTCAPKFTLGITGGKGKIEVDGATFDIERDWFSDDWCLS